MAPQHNRSEPTPKSPRVESRVRRAVRVALTGWFVAAFWWLPYREMTVEQRRLARNFFVAGFALAAIAALVGGSRGLTLVFAVFLAATIGALRLVDQDLAGGEPAGRTPLNLPSDRRS